jgi:formyl-CoA transferase
VNALVSGWAAQRSVDQAVSELVAAGVPAAPVRSYADAARKPLVAARDMLQTVVQADGRTAPVVGPPAKLSRTPTRVRSGAPPLGAHNDEILQELGLEASECRRLRQAGVI